MESKCPDTTRFIKTQLWPTWQTLGKTKRVDIQVHTYVWERGEGHASYYLTSIDLLSEHHLVCRLVDISKFSTLNASIVLGSLFKQTIKNGWIDLELVGRLQNYRLFFSVDIVLTVPIQRLLADRTIRKGAMPTHRRFEHRLHMRMSTWREWMYSQLAHVMRYGIFTLRSRRLSSSHCLHSRQIGTRWCITWLHRRSTAFARTAARRLYTVGSRSSSVGTCRRQDIGPTTATFIRSMGDAERRACSRCAIRVTGESVHTNDKSGTDRMSRRVHRCESALIRPKIRLTHRFSTLTKTILRWHSYVYYSEQLYGLISATFFRLPLLLLHPMSDECSITSLC